MVKFFGTPNNYIYRMGHFNRYDEWAIMPFSAEKLAAQTLIVVNQSFYGEYEFNFHSQQGNFLHPIL